MKKIALFLIIALTFTISVNAQVALKQTTSNPTGAISNASIDTMTIDFTRSYSRVLFSMTYTRSANTAAGTAILEYRAKSSDNYVADAGDTLTITNVASRTYNWNKANPAKQWRIRVGGATTVTATVASSASGVQ